MLNSSFSRRLAVFYRNIVFPLVSVFFLPVFMLDIALKHYAPTGHRLAEAFLQVKGVFTLVLFGLLAVWLAFRLAQTARTKKTAHQSLDTAGLADILLELIPSSPPAKPLERVIRALGRPLPEPWVKYQWMPPMLIMLGIILILTAPDEALRSLVGSQLASPEGRLQLLLFAPPLLTIVNLRLWAFHEHQRLQTHRRSQRRSPRPDRFF